MINFDNAATTGRKPQSVKAAVNRALSEYSANPGRGGHKLSLKAGETVYEAREKISGFFGASGGEHVIFTANCTSAINYVLKGYLKPGDHVIVSDLEHNAVMRPLEKTGVQKSIAQTSLTDDEITVGNFEKLIRENTKMIFCTAASNVCGKVLPVKELGALCKKRGIVFGVDAAQAAGILPINVKEDGIDFLCVAPHKGLYAPMGLGILIAETDIGDTLIEGGTGTNSISMYQPENMPERYESGTVNLPAIAGAAAGVDFARGYAERGYLSEMRHLRRLYAELSKLPYIRLYTPAPDDWKYMPVLSFNVLSVPSEKVAAYLDKRGIAVRAGLHCAPAAHIKFKTENTGTVRISPSVFSTAAEFDYLIKILKNNLLKKLVE
ncbi:MAG: aminotransferase class V-fold PLP-dependent enzyme [Clostridia bacterium]|nr:aminotransferase class V-fold PLP-dependent enzyme [Clostridia bacterium]